jgi:hypothetical protein
MVGPRWDLDAERERESSLPQEHCAAVIKRYFWDQELLERD